MSDDKKSLLTCPSCSTGFFIDAGLIGARGRKVKCTHCNYIWLQAPLNRATTPEERAPDAAPRLVPAHVAAASVRRPFRYKTWMTALVVLLAVFGYGGRHSVVAMWEPSAKIFELLHRDVPVAGEGLAFENVQITRRVDTADNSGGGSRSLLVVKGNIVNNTADVMDIPPLELQLKDAQNGAVASQTFYATATRVLPIESVSFETEMELPKQVAQSVTVTFARP